MFFLYVANNARREGKKASAGSISAQKVTFVECARDFANSPFRELSNGSRLLNAQQPTLDLITNLIKRPACCGVLHLIGNRFHSHSTLAKLFCCHCVMPVCGFEKGLWRNKSLDAPEWDEFMIASTSLLWANRADGAEFNEHFKWCENFVTVELSGCCCCWRNIIVVCVGLESKLHAKIISRVSTVHRSCECIVVTHAAACITKQSQKRALCKNCKETKTKILQGRRFSESK